MYSESERAIFGPFDRGDGQQVYADPLAVYRDLVLATGGEHNRLLTESGSEDELQRLAAEGQLIPAARQALRLVDFSLETGEGATDQQVLKILFAFTEWMSAKKEQGVI